jgi:hypothetical protein
MFAKELAGAIFEILLHISVTFPALCNQNAAVHFLKAHTALSGLLSIFVGDHQK